MTLSRPLWLTEEKLRRFREEDEPVAKDPSPVDPDWENVPVPDQVIMIQDDDDGNDSTELGGISEQITLISWKGDELLADEYIKKSGKRTTLIGREPRTAAVAVFREHEKTVIRFIAEILLEDLLEEWNIRGN